MTVHSTEVVVEADGSRLAGDLAVPRDPAGLVVFAHGSGSSRHSGRNQAVAGVLRRHRLATLLLDLLTADEDQADAGTGKLRFDIPLLAERVGAAVEQFREHGPVRGVPVGLFGASTGAAAALVAAGAHPVGAVVSRGGRPDLAGTALERVTAPTLLIVGGRDEQVLRLNQEAAARLRGPQELEVVAGAGHLFEEAGALDEVAGLAADWFARHLPE
ncbi:dienelactone hydrolase family protein [Amycolatopsis aidingensis]|uniref:dienelactone hydrolase family protein n=1 Tax=Amycolatopsis aidingensis TaxID=2842453 RepID=UPI001C0B4F2E|nr:dienelactone hydrolase family protein [Amycolatopsis aidingensis]